MGVAIPQVVSEDRASGAQIIDGGLRFDSGKSNYLSRTPSSAGNRKTFTWSGWVKRNDVSSQQTLFSAGNSGTNRSSLLFDSSVNGALRYFNYASTVNVNLISSQVFRDAAGWYHIVAAFDSTQATEANRLKFYVNGVQVTNFSTATYPSQNLDVVINNNLSHSIGRAEQASPAEHLSGQLSNTYFIDGQALDPSYFGYTDPLTNTWRPKKFKPQATPNNGTVWSTSGNFSGNVRSQGDSYGPPNMFNGILGNESTSGAVCFAPYSSNSTCTWTAPTTFTGLTSLRLYVDLSGSVGKLTVNGTDYSSLVTALSGGDGWITIPQTSLSTISFGYTNGLNDATGIAAVEVNGVILLDSDTTNMGRNAFYLPFDGSAPIGQDQSGRGNNWTPVNFGGSNTIEKATGALPILNTDGGGKVARVGVRTDSNASSLVLALPLVGIKSDFSNAVNSGTSNKAITATNAAGITTASNFYGGSFRFPGNASLTSPSNVDFALGTGDFTIEFWAYPTAYSTFDPYIITNVTNGFYIGKVDTVFALRAFNVGNLVTTTTFPPLNSWTHIAVTRQGTTARIFYNGVLITSGTTSQNFLQGELRIGDDGGGGGSSYINSFIQDVRIYKGVAKYTSNFIPASTDPDIVPDSPSGVSYSSNLTQITDGAVYFDGSGDYLSIANSTDFEIGSGDYTLELFVYGNSWLSSNGGSGILGKGNVTSLSGEVYTIQINNGTVQYYVFNSTTNYNNPLISSTSTLSTGSWHHIAISRSGNNTRLFVNGILQSTSTENYTVTTGGQVYIGTQAYDPGNSTRSHTGFISNLQIVKGTALYTSNFTPPSAPISSVANTKLLCCKSNTSATAADVTPGTITANGNAAASNFNPFTVNINTQRGKQSGYATWNPLKPPGGTTTFSNGNLDTTFAFNGSTFPVPMGNVGVYTGRWYWEITPISGASGSGGMGVGIGNQDCAPTGAGAMGVTANAWGYYYSGNKYNNNSSSSYGSSYTNGDIIGVALDANIGSLSFYKNGIYQGVAYSGLSNTNTYFPAVGNSGDTTTVAANFGQKPFKFPPPPGFQPLALANTPRPTIVRPDQYVGIATYSGDNGSARQVNIGFRPDFIWLKCRNSGRSHRIIDTVRGISNQFFSDSTSGGSTYDGTSYPSSVTSVNNNGFVLTNGGTDQYNTSGETYVAWAWKAGGNSNTYNIDDVGYATASAAGLTAGTITPTGSSVNTKSGFSILTYTGNNTVGATISHGLGRIPAFAIFKNRGASSDWQVYHQSLGNATSIILQTTAAAGGSSAFNSTSPTSTLFTFGQGTSLNSSGGTHVGYLWAEIPGFSKFGSYTGNGSADGPIIITGFRPRWLLIKQSSAGGENWRLFDTERDKYNPTQNRLLPNSSGAEAVGVSNELDTLSNGFKMRATDGASNGSGATYIYAAFAESPTFNLYGAQANAR